MPEGVVNVARPSRWGNPFTIEACIDAGFAENDRDARRICVDAFRDWLNGDTWAAGSSICWEAKRKTLIENLPQLRGKSLACYCPLDQPCHADVLLDFVDDCQHEDDE